MRIKQFRYTFTDPYILEELTRAYKRADVKRRIDLLSQFSTEGNTIPYELALQAVEDQSVEIREWIARFVQNYWLILRAELVKVAIQNPLKKSNQAMKFLIRKYKRELLPRNIDILQMLNICLQIQNRFR